MKRLFSRRNPDRLDVTISPFTIEDDGMRPEFVQKKIVEQTNGVAFQDISIGRKTRNALRRERMTSLESDFRVSRVDISPLSTESNNTSQPIRIPSLNKKDSSPGKQNWNQHPFATISEQARDISSAARSYLPQSNSLLTTTTSQRFLGEENRSFHYLNRQPSGEMNSWPSSVLMHPINSTAPTRLPISSPTLQNDVHSDQISWRESLEQHLSSSFGPDVQKEASSEIVPSIQAVHGKTQELNRNRSSITLAGNRKVSVPALRSAYHAKRQRESMLVSLGQDKIEVDEFGQLIEQGHQDQHPYVTKTLRQVREGNRKEHSIVEVDKQNFSLVTLKGKTEPSLFINTKQPKVRNNRDTFGVMLDRTNSNATPDKILPRTPPPINKKSNPGCPPTLGFDTPALIGTASSFSENTDFTIKVKDDDENKLSIKSNKHRINGNQIKDLPFPPSPHSGTFRFPALCLAAVDQAEALALAPQTPHTSTKGRVLCLSPSVSLASARFETISRGMPSEMQKEDDKPPATLGSPIRLTSEIQDGSSNQLQSKFSSSSEESSMYDFNGDSEEVSDVESLSESKGRLWEPSMKGTKSESQIYTASNEHKPQAFFESQSMPMVRLASDDREACMSAVPSSSEDVFRNSVHHQEEKESEESDKPFEQQSQSDFIVCNIIQQQEEAMKRLRNCNKWSPMKLDNRSQFADERLNSSWTWAATTDVSHGSMNEESASMDKCVDWECNGNSHDVQEVLLRTLAKQKDVSSTYENEAAQTKNDILFLQRRVEMVDKSTQTDIFPPPRPARSEARNVSQRVKEIREGTPKAPDICILLASPRKGDDQDPLDGLSINFGLGIITTDDTEQQEGTLDETLLTPRTAERDFATQETFFGALEVFEHEVNNLIETLSDTSSTTKRPTTIPDLLNLNSPPTNTSAIPTSFAFVHAPRDSTTTAAIEAMLEQLRIAQQSPKRLVLNTGGRRHEQKRKQENLEEKEEEKE